MAYDDDLARDPARTYKDDIRALMYDLPRDFVTMHIEGISALARNHPYGLAVPVCFAAFSAYQVFFTTNFAQAQMEETTVKLKQCSCTEHPLFSYIYDHH